MTADGEWRARRKGTQGFDFIAQRTVHVLIWAVTMLSKQQRSIHTEYSPSAKHEIGRHSAALDFFSFLLRSLPEQRGAFVFRRKRNRVSPLFFFFFSPPFPFFFFFHNRGFFFNGLVFFFFFSFSFFVFLPQSQPSNRLLFSLFFLLYWSKRCFDGVGIGTQMCPERKVRL